MAQINNHRDNTVIIIDSLDRDLTKYPNPNTYVIKMPYILRKAESIELLTLQLTRTETNVNSGNNTFILTMNNIKYTIIIPEAELLSGTSLATTLQNAFALVVPSSITIFNVTYLRKLTITNTENIPFTITVNENVSRLLGIIGKGIRGEGIVESSSTGVMQGTRLIDLNGTPYLILSINDYERILSPSNNMQSNFLTIPMENYAFGERFLINSNEKERNGVYILTNSQNNIFELRISFKRPDGSLYDFHGVDHLITIKVSRDNQRDY